MALPVEFKDVEAARVILSAHPGISARDAIHAAVMRRHGIQTRCSYDQHFDGLPWVHRIQP